MVRNLTVEIQANIASFQANLQAASARITSFANTAVQAGRNLGGALSNGFSQAGRSIAEFSRQAQDAAKIAAVGLSLPLLLLGKQAVSTFGEMDSLRRGLAALEKDGASLTGRLKQLNEIAKMPGLGMKESVQGDIRLRTVLNSIYGVDKAAAMSIRTMQGFGNAVALVGKGKSEFERALYGIQQLANTPFPLGEDLNIIKDAIPQVTPLLNEAFGTSRSEDFKKLGISSKQVMEVILGGLEKLPRATGGAKNGFENFGDTTAKAFDAIGAGIYKGLHIEEFLNQISNGIASLTEKFANLPGTTQTLIGTFLALAVALPPLIAGIGYFSATVLPAFRKGLEATKLVMAGISGPMILIGIAIAAVAIIIISNWDRIKAALVNTGVWDQLKGIVKAALGVISSVFGVFANLFQGDWKNMGEHILNLLHYFANAWISMTGGAVLAIGGLIAKGLAMAGLDDWANNVKTKMDEVEKNIESRKFKINAPSFNILDGFLYGGKESKAGKTNSGKTKPAKEAAVPGTASDYSDRIRSYFDKLKEEADKLQEYIDKRLAVGLHVSPESIRELSMARAELDGYQTKLEKIQKLTEQMNVKPINSRIDTVFDGSKDVAQVKTGVGNMMPKMLTLPQVAAKLDLKINKDNALGNVKSQIANLFGVGEGSDAFKGIFSKLTKGLGDKLLPETLKAQILDPLISLNDGIKSSLQNAAVSAFEGMGQLVGGLFTGAESLSSLPAIFGGILSGLMKSIGEAMIQFGIAGLAIQKLTLAPGVAIAAGIGLIALAGVLQATVATKTASVKSTAFADGGMVYGRTNAIVGEYPGAANNPEVIAPLNKLKGYIGNSGGGGRLYTEISGSNLRIILDRADESSSDFNGHY